MTIQSYQLHSYVKTKYDLTEQEFFGLPTGKRKAILDAVFEKFTNHRLYRDGLTNTKKPKDRFDNYRSYDHVDSFETLATDLNITKQKSKDRLEKIKRKIHLARRERFEARKRRKVNVLNKEVYEQKWKPRNKETLRRMDRLKKLKKKEQSQEYER